MTLATKKREKTEPCSDRVILWMVFWAAGTIGLLVSGNWLGVAIWQVISLFAKYFFALAENKMRGWFK